MRKTNIYIVTYKNKDMLHQNLSLLFKTLSNSVDMSKNDIKFHIINNHSEFYIAPEFEPYITIFHNYLRPDWSCGHLSRDYNAALMHGFKDLNNPAIDQLITVHDDVSYHDNWFNDLQDLHNTYDFYAGDYGCSMVSYTVDAVKNIGIWDERFCNIGFHEADMFLRAKIYYPEKSTINDHNGKRLHNPTKVLFNHPPSNNDKLINALSSENYHPIPRLAFADKWDVYPEDWAKRLSVIPTKPLINQHMFYPYFEKDIIDLEGKGYRTAALGRNNFKLEWH